MHRGRIARKYRIESIQAEKSTQVRSTAIFCRRSGLASKRLEDHIRRLVAKAAITSNSSELELVIVALRAALKEHVRRLRRVAVSMSLQPHRRDTDWRS